MKALDIIKKYLVDNGYDGLCNGDCGCGLDDLSPCGCTVNNDCMPAYKFKTDCKNCYRAPDCGMVDDVEGFCYGTKRAAREAE